MIDRKQLADDIRADQDRAIERTRARNAERQTPKRLDFDPFRTHWVRTGGPDPGYLPKTPMRRGKEGFWIACRGCGHKFESKGWAYCPACMELPAQERHDMRPTGRECEALGCNNVIAPTARLDARYCSDACRKRARRAISPDKNDYESPDTTPPQNVRDNAEKSEQNQGPKIDRTKKVGRPLNPERLAGFLKQIPDTAPGEMPDIPDFLKR